MSNEPTEDDYSLSKKTPETIIPAPDLPYQPRDPKTYSPKIGLIGCGGITEAHLTAYKAAGYNIAALCDPRKERAEKRRAQFYPDAKIFTDYRAFRHHASLLTPEEIRSGREKLGLNRQAFAQCFGIAVSTLSRWETGSQIQQRFHDGILRAFFAMPDLRTFLAKLHGVLYATNGASATTSVPVSAP